MNQVEKIRHTLAVKGVLFTALFVLMLITLSVQAQKPAKPTQQKAANTGQSKDKVYDMVDKLPTFPGGNKEFSMYLSKSIEYPKADREKNIQGKVYAQFIVERDGAITNVNTLRSPSKAMSAEAIRVLKDCPKWKPGTIKGKPVRALYTVPINFSLSA